MVHGGKTAEERTDSKNDSDGDAWIGQHTPSRHWIRCVLSQGAAGTLNRFDVGLFFLINYCVDGLYPLRKIIFPLDKFGKM